MANQVETLINVQRDNRNRKTVFWRGILVFPILIYSASMLQMLHWGATSGLITLPVVLTLVFRGVYPSYILSFNHALMELSVRIVSYLLFLTDDYPSIERNPNMAILLPDIHGGRTLSRWKPIFKFLFAIPLFIVGLFYSSITLILSLFAWLHILLFGKYPDPAINFVLGTVKFWNRVLGYAAILVTDEYPSLEL